MSLISDLASVLSQFPGDCRPGHVDALGSAGGFSGARFWRLFTARGPLCLRRWPREHPTPDRLKLIHAVLQHVDRAGFHLVPVPIESHAGETFVEHVGYLWELSPWLPGAPCPSDCPGTETIAAALSSLAQFHRAAESFPLPLPVSGPSPGIIERVANLAALQRGELARLKDSIDERLWPAGAAISRRLVELVPGSSTPVAALLHEAALLSVPWQPCLRDVWNDHVLFVEQRVTGFVDFGALRAENVAADVARLLGSMAGNDHQAWAAGLNSYESIRRLSRAENTLVAAFDRSSVLLSGLSWIDWIYCQQRHFENSGEIVVRLERLTRRLECLNRSWPLAVE